MRRLSLADAAAAFLLVGLATGASAAPDTKPAPASKTPTATPTSVPTEAGKKPEVDPLAAAYAVADRVDLELRKAVASVHESSVTVWNLRRRGDPNNPRFRRESGGSGVLIEWKGQGPFVISNEHVVQGADKLELVLHDGKVHEARVRDRVRRYDIALLEFAKTPKGLRAAKIGKSESLAEGRWVFATGNPFFLGGDGCCVATLGVVSGLDRTLRGDFTYANAIQHDTEVNPGNSGGPLWNLSGELLGINGMMSSRDDGASAGHSNTGASFSIPMHLIAGYLDALLSEKVAASAGTLGLELVDSKDKTGKPNGATVQNVRADSPLRQKASGKIADLEKGDVIVRVWFGASTLTMKAYDVYSASDVTNALAFYCSGSKARIKYVHKGKDMQWEGALSGGEGP